MSVHMVSGRGLAAVSSKGNQEKWRENGRWYKLDQFGYEALAETLISLLLEYSSLERDTPFRFVRYRMERVPARGLEQTGCSSRDFLRPGQNIISLNRLFRLHGDRPLSELLTEIPSVKRRMACLAEAVAELTGLTEFPEYLTVLFEVDALFLNGGRHLDNIAVLEQDGKYDYCPIFGNGAGLLSNAEVFPMDADPAGLLSSVTAHPFHTTFTRQCNTAQALFGRQFQIPDFSRACLLALLEPLLTFYPEQDREQIVHRVCTVVLTRQKTLHGK